MGELPMSEQEEATQPAATIDEQSAAKRIEWQAEKLRNRFNTAMDGVHLGACAMALADTFYRVLATTSQTPVEAGATLLALLHKQVEDAKPRIVAP